LANRPPPPFFQLLSLRLVWPPLNGQRRTTLFFPVRMKSGASSFFFPFLMEHLFTPGTGVLLLTLVVPSSATCDPGKRGQKGFRFSFLENWRMWRGSYPSSVNHLHRVPKKSDGTTPFDVFGRPPPRDLKLKPANSLLLTTPPPRKKKFPCPWHFARPALTSPSAPTNPSSVEIPEGRFKKKLVPFLRREK